MLSRSVQVVHPKGKISFFSMAELYTYITFSFSINSLMKTGCFHVLSIVNNTAMNMEVQVCFEDGVFVSLR